MAMQLSPIILLQSDESGRLHEDKKNSSSGTALTRCKSSNHLLGQANAVGIIGGASVFSTLIFLEKLVWWSSKTGEECIPFVVCNDPNISRQLPFHPAKCKNSIHLNQDTLVENLRSKRVFLEQSGVHCIVMPCHKSHAWLVEVSEGCSVPFLSACVCVARELKEAKLKPLEAGSNPRIGLLGADTALMIGHYQEQLERQGFEVVLLDKATMEHTVIPAILALNRKDMEGARNLLRIAIQVLLIRAVNCVILASDEFLGVLPRGDPLLKKCVDPMDALARSTLRWAKSTEKIHK